MRKDEYLTARKELKNLCKEKQKEKAEVTMKEIRQARSEKEIWDYINKGRKLRVLTSEKVKINEWRAYFMKLLRGDGNRKISDWRWEEISEEEDEDELTDEEIRKHIRNLKKKKVTELDGIPNEAWIYMQGRTEQEWCELVKKIWKGKGIPEGSGDNFLI